MLVHSSLFGEGDRGQNVPQGATELVPKASFWEMANTRLRSSSSVRGAGLEDVGCGHSTGPVLQGHTLSGLSSAKSGVHVFLWTALEGRGGGGGEWGAGSMGSSSPRVSSTLPIQGFAALGTSLIVAAQVFRPLLDAAQ